MGCLNSKLTNRKDGMMMSKQSCRNERAEDTPNAVFNSRTNLYDSREKTMAEMRPVDEVEGKCAENASA